MRAHKNAAGYSLVEAIIAMIILAIMVASIAQVYNSGLLSLETQSEYVQLDSVLRSYMESLISLPFKSIVSGNATDSSMGRAFKVVWTVSLYDIDGDLAAEPDAKEIVVSVNGYPNRSLTTVVVDHGGRVAKF